jgi:hypothetical protein
VVGADWRIVGTADLTGNGSADLLWQHQTDGAVILHTYEGTTLTGAQVIPLLPDTPWRVVATGDVDGDGHNDIIWHHEASGQVYIWYMSATPEGQAVFLNGSYVTHADMTTPVTLNPAARTEWRIAGAGDVSGDGKLDLIWRNVVTGAAIAWTLDNAMFTGTVDWGIVNPAWQLRGVGYYAGDAAADLVWQHAETGQIYLWVREAGELVPNTSVGATQLTWQIVGAR